MLRQSFLCLALLAGFAAFFAAGCSSRTPAKDYTLKVTSMEDDVQYTLNGTIILDGVKTEVVEQKTPYQFAGNGLNLQATLTSRDLDCHLKGALDVPELRELVSTSSGPNGAVVTVEATSVDRDLNMQITVKPLKIKGAKTVAEAKPEEVAKPKEVAKPEEMTKPATAPEAPTVEVTPTAVPPESAPTPAPVAVDPVAPK